MRTCCPERRTVPSTTASTFNSRAISGKGLTACLTIANIGVHGTKVALHFETLWDPIITITTRLVDTVSTPMLMKADEGYAI